jgi:salicylate hydroxylase
LGQRIIDGRTVAVHPTIYLNQFVANRLTIGVVGGGIGGMSAALSLLQAGFNVHVYEQATQLREVGAGVQVSVNASRVLYRLGLADALAATAVRPLAMHQRRWDDGRTLLRAALGEAVEQAYGFPYFHLHRADLLTTLANALPPERLHLGHRLVDFKDCGDRVHLAFADRPTVDVDVLIGADGIHSAVRSLLFGPEHPRFTGCIAYRGLVPAARLAHLDVEASCEVWLGPGRHFVHYFVRGKQLVNFVACIEQDEWVRESWTQRGRIDDVLEAFKGWHPQIPAIINAADETHVWALFDRAPMPSWTAGRVALLGDACHAMLPFMAQGAAQSIEDGATLAACLATADPSDVTTALRRYQELRLPRASLLQSMSTDNKARNHLPDGPAQQERDAQLAAGASWSFNSVDWLYRHDAAQLPVE